MLLARRAFFESDKILKYCLGFLCSKVAATMLAVINPTINVQAVDIEKLPIIIDDRIFDEVIKLVDVKYRNCYGRMEFL